jgi:hypothetical protein
MTNCCIAVQDRNIKHPNVYLRREPKPRVRHSIWLFHGTPVRGTMAWENLSVLNIQEEKGH